MGNRTGQSQKVAVADGVQPLIGRIERYLPQLARSSHPLKGNE